MGSRTGGLFQRNLWQRKTMRAPSAILLADEIRGHFWGDWNFETFQRHCEVTAMNWFGSPRA